MNRTLPPLRLATVLAAALAAAPATAAPAGQASSYWGDDLALVVRTQELKIPEIERALALLDIRPGMTILDIGAGTGQPAYKLAAKLAGTGRVIATDVEPSLVDYVNAQAAKRGLKNLRAVLVSKNGVDPKYDAERYDLILLYDVVSFLSDRVRYYRQLRGLLKPGGRIAVVMHMGPTYGFSVEDFKDWKGFVAALRAEPPDSPFHRQLRVPLQPVLDAYPDPAEKFLERSIQYQLNVTLGSEFFAEFTKDMRFLPPVSFTPAEETHASWLLHRLKLAGLPEKRPVADVAFREWNALQQLNKLILIQRYRSFLIEGGPRPYMTGGVESRWYRENDPLVSEFQVAGYALEAKYDSAIPFMAVYTFAPAGAK